MKPRIYFSITFAFACLSLLAQPKILSITYNGDEAILTRNTPPPGIVYYWQGTSCGSLMTNSAATYVATTSSTYYLREYYSTSALWALSCASTIVIFPDMTPPVLSNVTPGPVGEGSNIAATSNENGMIYLVPEGTAASIGSIVASEVASAVATANVAVTLATAGIDLGNYIVFAVDGSDNISAASAVIAVVDLTAPVLSDVSAGPVNAGEDILATSNENGMIYLVPSGTAPNLGAITSAQVAQATSTATVSTTLATTGLPEGDYVVYAVDESDNISAASAAITVTWATYIELNSATSDQVQLYPANVKDILHIKSDIRVTSAIVYSLQGARMIHITEPTDQIDMSSLKSGVYIVSVKLQDNTVFNGKITKR